MPSPLQANDDCKRQPAREAMGVIAGAGTILFVMIGLAVIAIAIGLMDRGNDGVVDLNGWLMLELVGGALVGVVGGRLCRRVARGSTRAVWLLAGISLTLGMLETLEILRAVETEAVIANRGVALAAPIVVASAALVGGLRPSFRVDRVQTMRLGRALGVPALFVAIGALAAFLVPRAEVGTEQRVLSAAFGADLTIAVPAFVYFAFVRTKRAPLFVLAPTIIVGFVVASLAIPQEHHGVVDAMRYALLPAEIALLAYLVFLARRAFASDTPKDADFVARLRAAARNIIGAHLPADVLITEASVLYYALNPRPRSGPADGFTVYRETGYPRLLAALSVMVVLEIVGIHLLVSLWSPVAAWILTGLSLYAIVWLLGDFQAMRSRVITISESQLRLRIGLRWEADISLTDIGEASRTRHSRSKRDRSTLVLAIAGATNVQITFCRPIELIGPYGIRRRSTSLRMHVDDADTFCERLRVAQKRPDTSTPVSGE